MFGYRSHLTAEYLSSFRQPLSSRRIFPQRPGGLSYENCAKVNDWASDGLKGKIKSLKQEAYYAVEKSGKLEKGKRVESVLIKWVGTAYSNYFIKYDASGRCVEEWHYDEDEDGAFQKMIYTYDEQGRLNKIEKSWTEHNNEDGGRKLGKNRKLEKHIYKYEACGHEFEFEEKNKNRKDRGWEVGYIIRSDIYGAGEEDKCTYDHQGNWIKKIEYKNDKPQTIIERTIEYYE